MNRTRILFFVAVAAVFAAGGYWLAASRAPHRHELEQKQDAQGKSYWTCAMHPEVRKDEPGNCPICGMQLIEKREEALSPGPSPASGRGEPDGASGIVRIDPRMAQNLGVRTAPVTRGAFAHSFDAVGAVEVDERLIFAAESRAEGWVEQLDVRAVGEPVRKGQAIAGVYSPELYSAQEELLLAARSKDAGLINASRQRLLLLGMYESQIDAVLASGRVERRVRVAAPSSGVVTELNVREGQKVMPGMPLVRIADLSRVWITIEVPESLAAWVKPQGRAEARLSALPGRSFEGRVDYVYPGLDTATRTVRARLVFANRDGALKPGMYANVAILAGAQQDALLVPVESVIRTGKRTVVIVAEGEGRFRPAEVTLGPEHEGTIVILAGLEEGQQVVTSGQFLIDSEASLRGMYQRLDPSPQPSPRKRGEGEPHQGHAP
jgi:membrane fusion protein, copper/silver efflux system